MRVNFALAVTQNFFDAYVLGAVLCNLAPVQRNGLTLVDTDCPVHLGLVNAPSVLVSFSAGYKECAPLMPLKKASKFKVATTHHIERPWLQEQDARHIDLVYLAVADLVEVCNGAPPVQRGVQLEVWLGFAKRRPLEQAQVQIDGGCVQFLDFFLEIEPQVLVHLKLASAPDQNCGQVGPDSLVVRPVAVLQGKAVNLVVKSHGLQFARVGSKSSKSHIDVSQTVTVNQLCKSHGSKLLGASRARHARIAILESQVARKVCPWSEEIHDLGNHGLADTHRRPSRSLSLGNYSEVGKRVLNRHQIKLASSPRHCWYSLQINPV